MSAVWAITASTLLCLPACSGWESSLASTDLFFFHSAQPVDLLIFPCSGWESLLFPSSRRCEQHPFDTSPPLYFCFLLSHYTRLEQAVLSDASHVHLRGRSARTAPIVLCLLPCVAFLWADMLVWVMCSAVAGVCTCVCVWGGGRACSVCFCPDQLAKMGYYGDGTCCARSGIRSFPHFSKWPSYLH